MAPAMLPGVEFRTNIKIWRIVGNDGGSFVPYSNIHRFLTIPRIKSILSHSSNHIHERIDWDMIRSRYLRVFSILLVTENESYISYFTGHRNLDDGHLPFQRPGPPPHWPQGLDHVFDTFYKAQWQFCAREFSSTELDMMQDEHLEDDLVLPIEEKKLLRCGDMASTYRIKIHPDYDRLQLPDKDTDLLPRPEFFVLKVYDKKHRDAEKYYANEVHAFRKMRSPNKLERHMVTYLGSYRQRNTYNIILEYADKGNLREYFQHTKPPRQEDEIATFWRNLVHVVQPLQKIHNLVIRHGEVERYFQGVHQDLKPENILVTSGPTQSPYDVTFKIADFGLSHFILKTEETEEVELRDSYGTPMYSAPECCRFDRFMGSTKIPVKSSIDIWSLGCIFSEAAVWVVLGYNEVLEYAESRKTETDQEPLLSNSGNSGCFHDGLQVLDTVKTMHRDIKHQCRQTDRTTENVVRMIEGMLETQDARWSVPVIWKFAQKELFDQSYPPAFRMRPAPVAMRSTPDDLGIMAPRTPKRSSTQAESATISSPGVSPRIDPPSRRWTADSQRPFSAARSSVTSTCNPQGSSPSSKRNTMVESNTDPGDGGLVKSLVPNGSTIPKRTDEETETPMPNVSIEEVLEWIRRKKSASPTRALPGADCLKELAERDHIFLVDDSSSMRNHWEDVKRVFHALAYLVKEKDPDGIELFFSNSLERYRHKHTKALRDVLQKRHIGNICDMKMRLGRLLEDYREQLEKSASRLRLLSVSSFTSKKKHGLNIYVLTDAVWQRNTGPLCDVDRPIRLMVTYLKDHGLLDSQVGIQFIQFGNDYIGTQRLQRLDNLKPEIGMDIVDTTQYRKDANVYKMLLGAIRRDWDNDATLVQPSSSMLPNGTSNG